MSDPAQTDQANANAEAATSVVGILKPAIPPLEPLAKVEKIPLPEDFESRISVLLLVSGLVMQERVTHLAYKDEVNQKEKAGLSRSTRDVDKATAKRIALHIRLYGPLSQLGGQGSRPSSQKWIILGLFMLVSTVAFISYLQYSPQAQIQLEVWWAGQGAYLEVFLLFVALVTLFILYRRSRKKPKVT